MIQAQWTASEARRVLAAADRSGLSIDAYAQAQNINPSRLYWWRKRLRGEKAARKAAQTSALVPSSRSMSFVELSSDRDRQEALFEIVLANGRIVRVPSSFDDGALSRVLAAADGVA